MNELQIVNFDGVEVVDSRDVAKMVEREHKDLLKSIRLYTQYLAEGKFAPGDFFIENTYFDANNQERQNYLITKKGCDLIANKVIGKKGVLFTAAYVKAFERMREHITKPKSAAELIAAQAQVLVDMERRMDEMQGQARALEDHTKKLEAKVDTAIKAFSHPDKDHWVGDMDQAIKQLCADMKTCVPKMKGKLYAELEEKANCDINRRLSALRRRQKKTGVRYKDAAALTKLDAIAADKKLRAIFEGIVRSWQARVVPAPMEESNYE